MSVSINSTTSSAATQPYVPNVAATSAAALSSQAVSLSAQSAVVATLGGTTGATVYTPAGLMNSLQQAGTTPDAVTAPTDGSNVDTSNTAQDAQDQSIVSSLSGSASSSGVYTGAGTVSGLSEQASSNWADILKTNPGMAATVIGSSFELGIVSTLQIKA